MENEIIPADKRHRRLVLMAALLVTVAGLLVLGALNRQMREIDEPAEGNPQAAIQKARRLTTVVAWVGGLSFVGAGAWLWRLGRRINRAGRFPPPGMKVVKDTPVRTGAKAQTVASLAEVTALVCVVVGTAGMWYLWRLAQTVLR